MSAMPSPPPSTFAPTPSPAPPVPRTLEDTGLGADQIEQLLVKTLYAGERPASCIAERMRLPFTMLEPLIERAARRAADRSARRDRVRQPPATATR